LRWVTDYGHRRPSVVLSIAISRRQSAPCCFTLQCIVFDTAQRLWALVIHDPADDDDLVLLTNVPLTTHRIVRQVYGD